MAVPSQVLREVEHANREANRLRESSTYREARVKFDRVAANWRSDIVSDHKSRTIHDEILDIERGVAARREQTRWGQVKVTHIYKCRACGASLPKGCPSNHHEYESPLNGQKIVEDPFPCPNCGEDPWSFNTFNVAPQAVVFKPYWDVSLGRDARCVPGVTYVPGKGHRISSLSALREFARANGKDYR